MRLSRIALTALLASQLAGAPASAGQADSPGAAATASGQLVREGVRIEFEARPADGSGALIEGLMADLRFKVSDAASGQPITGLGPGAWLDLGQNVSARGGEQKECKDKIGLYLSGVVGIRPMVDLNSYFLLVMNRDPSITVIDPVVSVAGSTSTYKNIVLKRAPMDWVRSADGKRLFVSMPTAGQVAVIDSENFSVLRDVDAGREPVRVALQPDGRYLWVGNNARDAAVSGVTVIDTASLEKRAFLPTGRGHHEIAFSGDARLAFVSNRESGSVTVIDVATLKPLTTIASGPRPISLGWSEVGQALYVADAQTGAIRVFAGNTLAERASLAAKPGLGPLRFTQDGRFAFALNTFDSTASVIDTGSASLIHTIAVAAEPYQLSFTRGFAYIRGLASERVTMVNLSSLGSGRNPTVQSFAAGALPPRAAGDLPLAESLAAARDDAAVFVVNPADNSTYFYMEGMNAPMANYPSRGFNARAATVIDRSMRESAPGVYGTRVRLPASGKFDVAFMLDRPRVLHCFEAQVEPNPVLEQTLARIRVEFLDLPQAAAGARDLPIRFRLLKGRERQGLADVADVRLRYFLAPASPPREVSARHIGDGMYEARIDLPESGAYYLHVGAASLDLPFGKSAYRSLRVLAAPRSHPAPSPLEHTAAR